MQQAALARLRDALALRDRAQARGGDPNRWGGAKYLAGIAVECQAKWVLCERTQRPHVDDTDPDLVSSRRHDLELILERADVLNALRRSDLASAWDAVRAWEVDWRYNPPEPRSTDHREAERFVAACEAIIQWLATRAG